MKKRFAILSILIGVSAFSFSINSANHNTAPAARVVKKTPNRTGLAPLADLALLPALNG